MSQRFKPDTNDTAITAACQCLEQAIDLAAAIGTALEAADAKRLPAFTVARVMLDANEFVNRFRGHSEALQHGAEALAK